MYYCSIKLFLCIVFRVANFPSVTMEEKWRTVIAELFSNSLLDMMYIVPCQEKWDPSNPKPASSLKMEVINAWPSTGCLPSDINSHFVCTDVRHLGRSFPDVQAIFQQRFRSILEQLDGTDFIRRLPFEISSCMASIEKYYSCIEKSELNEAAVRANEIVYMICALNKYYFRVEHRIVTDDDGNGSSSDLSDGISSGSVADYICYSIHDKKKLVTVILETKQQFSVNGLAQLLGYYYCSATSHQDIGLCLLLTKRAIHFILCPFRDQNDALVNAICLKEITFENLHGVLYLIAILTSTYFSSRQSLIVLEERFLPIHKDFQFYIETKQDKLVKLIKNLQDTVKKLEKECKQHTTEIARLKCKYVPVEVSLTRND